MRLSVDEVFDRYGDRIFLAAFSVCRNRADADDVVQDTLIRYNFCRKDTPWRKSPASCAAPGAPSKAS